MVNYQLNICSIFFISAEGFQQNLFIVENNYVQTQISSVTFLGGPFESHFECRVAKSSWTILKIFS